MTNCLFASDLHGSHPRYEKLLEVITLERPAAVFLGGDLLPSGIAALAARHHAYRDFVREYLVPSLDRVHRESGPRYPRIFAILGNDDPRSAEVALREAEQQGLLTYVHNRKAALDDFSVYGYACVPPTPFLLKDWERYDVSRYVDPGSVSPEEGFRTVAVAEGEIRHSTMASDLAALAGNDELDRSIFLFHCPPYDTHLDRAALDGQQIDHVPLDVHIGSIAIRRFIESRQPRLALHGHVHESARLTGSWQDRLGRTVLFSAAHDGPQLALVRFDLHHPATATRELL